MHELLWAKLAKMDGKATAKRAKCPFNEESESYRVSLLGDEYVVQLDARKIIPAADEQPDTGFLEQLCILAYLINATEVPPADRLVSAEKLEAGEFFFRGPHELPVRKLEEVFGDDPEMLYEASESLEARRCEYGDASVEIKVLPRLAVVFVVWGRDEEFEARASILFDETADRQLPLDALGAAVQLTIAKVLQAVR